MNKFFITKDYVFWNNLTEDKPYKDFFDNWDKNANWEEINITPNWVNELQCSLVVDSKEYKYFKIVSDSNTTYWIVKNIEKKLTKGYVINLDLDIYTTYIMNWLVEDNGKFNIQRLNLDINKMIDNNNWLQGLLPLDEDIVNSLPSVIVPLKTGRILTKVDGKYPLEGNYTVSTNMGGTSSATSYLSTANIEKGLDSRSICYVSIKEPTVQNQIIGRFWNNTDGTWINTGVYGYDFLVYPVLCEYSFAMETSGAEYDAKLYRISLNGFYSMSGYFQKEGVKKNYVGLYGMSFINTGFEKSGVYWDVLTIMENKSGWLYWSDRGSFIQEIYYKGYMGVEYLWEMSINTDDSLSKFITKDISIENKKVSDIGLYLLLSSNIIGGYSSSNVLYNIFKKEDKLWVRFDGRVFFNDGFVYYGMNNPYKVTISGSGLLPSPDDKYNEYMSGIRNSVNANLQSAKNMTITKGIGAGLNLLSSATMVGAGALTGNVYTAAKGVSQGVNNVMSFATTMVQWNNTKREFKAQMQDIANSKGVNMQTSSIDAIRNAYLNGLDYEYNKWSVIPLEIVHPDYWEFVNEYINRYGMNVNLYKNIGEILRENSDFKYIEFGTLNLRTKIQQYFKNESNLIKDTIYECMLNGMRIWKKDLYV